MLLNFAHDFLGTAVSCNKVSVDGYECSNLTDANFLTRKKGYIAEHFIKPPVSITFTFPCAVNISHIVLEPYVGQQQCLQIDLLCATTPKALTTHGKKLQTDKLLGLHHQSSFQRESSLQAFHVVSKINCSSQSSICFYSPRFNHRSGAYKHPMEHVNKSEMRHFRAELLTSASHMTIKIVRTQSGSTPALSNVEIWGCISSSVCKEIKKIVEGKYISLSNPDRFTASISSSSQSVGRGVSSNNEKVRNGNCGGGESSKAKNGDDIEIPEEFLDPLTFEVMTIPMLLPCGKNVDKHSLDRFTDSEASHGRQPRDPFTGVEFSANIKPISNLDLKARIDSFLLSHSNVKSLSSIPRTVCTGKSSALLAKKRNSDTLCDGRQISSLVSTNKRFLGNDRSIRKVVSMSTRDNTFLRKESSISSSVSDMDKTLHSVDVATSSKTITGSHCGTNFANSTSSVSSSCASKSDIKCSKSHDDHLRDSLNTALSSLLSSGSSVANKVQNVVSPNSFECLHCNKAMGETGNVAYTSPCSHLICRECLLSFQGPNIYCPKCKSDFKKNDVIRSH